MKKNYDICIIGSGAGAGPIAYELSKAGFSVVILEKGPWIKTSQFTKDEIVAARRDVYTPRTADEPQVVEWRDKDGKLHKKSNADGGINFWNGNCVGGSSNFMSGYFHRAKPVDFKLLSTYGEIDGANISDWPVSYEEMEPYFTKVETLVGISGKVVKHSMQEPRSTADFPYPPLSVNYVSELLDKAAATLGYEIIPMPRAILSKAKDERHSCYYSNYCGSYGCSSDAKGSSRAALLNAALKTGNLAIIPYAKVYKLLVGKTGKVDKALFHYGTSNEEIEARIFVVAAQAIESSRLLLMSKSKDFTQGLANNNGQVGKNLIFSAGGIGSGYFKKSDFTEEEFAKLMMPGLFVNRAVQQWYEINDESFGGKAKGGTIDFLWEHANPIRRAIYQKWDDEGNLLFGSEYKKRLHAYFTQSRKLNFEVFNDWLPNDDCFVSLDEEVKDRWGDPVAKIRIENHPHDLKVGRYLATKAEKILQTAGAREVSSSISGSPPPNLQAGGCRFGTDPAKSVLDKDCKAHEVDNLYVTDGSFMPTGGSVTYTWTIYANSFRVADKILERLK